MLKLISCLCLLAYIGLKIYDYDQTMSEIYDQVVGLDSIVSIEDISQRMAVAGCKTQLNLNRLYIICDDVDKTDLDSAQALAEKRVVLISEVNQQLEYISSSKERNVFARFRAQHLRESLRLSTLLIESQPTMLQVERLTTEYAADVKKRNPRGFDCTVSNAYSTSGCR